MSAPPQWHELPDIALYMDQIIAYMPRQLIRFDDREAPHLRHGEQLHQGRAWCPGRRASGTGPSTWATSRRCAP